jgi:hypothetical protein
MIGKEERGPLEQQEGGVGCLENGIVGGHETQERGDETVRRWLMRTGAS